MFFVLIINQQYCICLFQDEDPIFLEGQMEICKLLGYLPVLDSSVVPKTGQYMPGTEKKRQFQG